MERKIILGKLDTFKSNKNGNIYFTIDVLECESGKAVRYFITQNTYEKLKLKNLKTNNSYTAIYVLDIYNQATICDIK